MCKPCLEDAEYAEQHKTEIKLNRDIDRMRSELWKGNVVESEDSPQPWDTVDYLDYYSDNSQSSDEGSDYLEDDLENTDISDDDKEYPDEEDVKAWEYRE